MAEQKTPVVKGNARFTVYGRGCVRLEYAWEGRFSRGPSVLTAPVPARPRSAEVLEKKDVLVIRTASFCLEYRDDGRPFHEGNLLVRHQDKDGREVTWKPGKPDRGNLGTVTRSLDRWQWCGGPRQYPQEGILSTDGGHFVPDEPRTYWHPKYRWPQVLSDKVAFDGYFFAYGRDYKAALKDFVTVFGPVPMVPRWTFGFWYSRWFAYTDREVIDLVKRYRKENVPIDVMIIDTDWRDGWGGYDWSSKYFPRPAATIRELHRLGTRVSLNDHPGYDNYDPLPSHDSHIPAVEKALGPLPHQGQWACDWSNAGAVRAWKDILLGPFFEQGIDFWWVDGWIKSPMGGLDSQLWANLHYYELAREKTGKRGMILSRWGGIGSHRYPVQFSGDTHSEWNTLRHQVEFTASSAGLCAVYWSHDIGGFMGRDIDEELFIRWSQFGAMSPVFRTHSDHGKREPWLFRREALRIFRKQARIRYALAPYFYQLAREAHTDGLPIARPLFLDYEDGGAYGRRQQYSLGRDLLVIPADEPMGKGRNSLRKRAYFPRGTWYGLETSEVVRGYFDGDIEIPLDRIPTYVRAGALLPCEEPREAMGTSVSRRLYLDYWPAVEEVSRLALYEDDGESMDFEKKGYAVTRITGRVSGGKTVLDISAPKGSYRGMPARRDYVVRVRIEPGLPPVGVRVRTGKSWKVVDWILTHACLAGTVESGHQFCEIELGKVSGSARIELSW